MFLESNIAYLYNQTVSAFPHTKKRQHAINPIAITEIHWTPFLGLNTLLIRGRTKNSNATRGYSEYKTLILIKNVNYQDGKNLHNVEIIADNNRKYYFEKLSIAENDVLVRCDCKDFKYRFSYYNHLDKSLYGRKPAKYESKGGSPANPLEHPGMCKHIIKTINSLEDAMIFA